MRADSGEDATIDYVVNLVDLNWYYYAIAIGLFVVTGLIWKRWRIAALAASRGLMKGVRVFGKPGSPDFERFDEGCSRVTENKPKRFDEGCSLVRSK